MKNLILFGLLGAFAVIPGDSSGFPHGGGQPVAVRPAPPVYHTPAFVAPRPVAPVAVRPVAPAYRPAFVPQQARPVIVNRPPVVNVPAASRPAVGFGYRPAVISRPAMVSRNIYVNRQNGLYRPGYAYYHNWYAGWHHGYWSGWYNNPGIWFGAGVATGWLFSPGSGVVYWNPYYVAIAQPVYDYSQLISVPAPELLPAQSASDAPPPDGQQPPPVQPPPTSANNENAAVAAKMLDDARQAFAGNDYDKAQQIVDAAIAKSPNDTTLHEFRALVLFARQKYQEAAGTIYGVLAVGPGWDWDTLRALYPDVNVYTGQLRALENFAKANPADAGSRFLLAYHYLVLDHRDAAATTLRKVVELQPKDELAAHLLQMLEKKPDTNRPVPGM